MSIKRWSSFRFTTTLLLVAGALWAASLMVVWIENFLLSMFYCGVVLVFLAFLLYFTTARVRDHSGRS